MARIEKTVFISYRRKDIAWALAVYQFLTSRKYDVFFDYTSIPSGDFEQIIVSNIKARAHFILILTPTALDRCNEPGDWLRREIETAVDEKRNIIPLFFDGFSFSAPAVAEKLTGKLSAIKRYNGLEIPSGYFLEAMERLCGRDLNVQLNAVIHPISTEVRKVVKEEQVAANKALLQQKEDIEKIIKPVEEKLTESLSPREALSKGNNERGEIIKPNLRPYGIGAGILLIAILGIFGINSLIQSAGGEKTPMGNSPSPLSLANTMTPALPTQTRLVPSNTLTPVPPFPDLALGVGSMIIFPKDGMALLYVPAGEFTMGSEYGNSYEKPVHTVYVDNFWVDQTEVTNAMFVDFLNDIASRVSVNKDELVKFDENLIYDLACTDCVPTWVNQILWNGDRFSVTSGYDDYPAVLVTWYGANAYCSWAGRRLPTEAEWEKAASWNKLTQTKYVYPWGNDFMCQNGNFDDETQVDSFVVPGGENCDGFPQTSPVKSFPSGVSPYGSLNMAGNVWEWVSSTFKSYPYDAADGREGLSVGTTRVMKGGSWLKAMMLFDLLTAWSMFQPMRKTI